MGIFPAEDLPPEKVRVTAGLEATSENMSLKYGKGWEIASTILTGEGKMLLRWIN
jgi:hypothetical protein